MDSPCNCEKLSYLHTVEILNPYGPVPAGLSNESTHSRNFESLWTPQTDEKSLDLHTVEILNPYGPRFLCSGSTIYTQ